MRKLNYDEIVEKAKVAFEEESQEAKDFLERNIDDIAKELIRLETTEEDFLDFLQNEVEKYTEYADKED